MKKSIFTRILALSLVFCLALSLAACGGSASSAAPSTPKDLAKILTESRDAEMNQYYEVVANGENGLTLTEGYSAEMDDQFKADQAAAVLQIMGLDPADTEDFAVSISMMMTKSYGIAIVKPAEGRSEAVQTALQNFIQAQQAAQEFYLPDQYEIAKAAVLEQAADGTWVMVMSENASAESAAILEALK